MHVRFAFALISLAVAAGCGGDDRVDALEKQLKSQGERIESLETFLQPFMEQPQRPPEPDPALVYAVPIDGAPVKGPADAAVTIVEAFEFA